MPTEQSSKDSLETKILTEFYTALSGDDIDTIAKLLDPDMAHIEFEGTPMAGAFHGSANVLTHISEARATWAEGACEPKRFLIAGNKVVVFVHVRVKLKKNMEWVEGKVTDVFTFKGGKILEMRTFGERQEALKWAGVQEV